MQVQFGTVCPDGFLPIFSVETEDEARRLLVLTCSRGADGELYARELVRQQASCPEDDNARLEAFYAFGDRCRRAYAMMKPEA